MSLIRRISVSVCMRASVKLYKSAPALTLGALSNSAAVHTKEHTRLAHCVPVLVHILHYNKVREKCFTYSLLKVAEGLAAAA